MKWAEGSYHCLMIDLNDFISSMDFLTAVSEGLMERQRNVTISCCSSSANHTTAWNIRQEYAVRQTPTWGSSKRFTLTPSVVPVMTCKPSYVDLIYMPCGRSAQSSVHTAYTFMSAVQPNGEFVLVNDEQQGKTHFQGFAFQTHAV